MKRKWMVLFCLLLCLLPMTVQAVRRGDVVRISHHNAVNVRKGPGTEYGQIGEAQPENVYPCLEKVGDWYHIRFTGNVEGYVSASLTTLEPGFVPDDVGNGEQVIAVVRNTHVNALNVRYGPGKKYDVFAEIRPDSTYPYLGTDDGWNIIQFDDERIGYVAANRTEIEVIDVVAGPTLTAQTCTVCEGSGQCMTCQTKGYVYSVMEKAYMECPSCCGLGFCWACTGEGGR